MKFLSGKREDTSVPQLDSILYDETVQVVSNFELNQIASLTYGELVCDNIFETLEKVFSQPMKFTILVVQKGLVICKHVLIYGSEKCVNSAYGLGQFISDLGNFNTVLMAQKKRGPMAVIQRIQGGGVDRGGPIRDAAEAVTKLLSNINQLQQIRNDSADPNSLVPVGDNKVAFVTDDVRQYLLNRRIEKQKQINIKSNLAKAEGGFGGGYTATDGRNVVGAAHGIDEMLKMVKKEKKKYTDESEAQNSEFSDYRAPTDIAILKELAAQQKAEARAQAEAAAAATANSNLWMGQAGTTTAIAAPNQNGVDLLGFHGEDKPMQAPTPPAMNAAMTAAHDQGDLLGLSSNAHIDPFAATLSHQPNFGSDLLGVFAADDTANNSTKASGIVTEQALVSFDPVGSLQTNGMHGLYSSSSSNGLHNQGAFSAPSQANPISQMLPTTTTTTTISAPIMNQMASLGHDDPFNALESLTISDTKRHVATLESVQAENRILSGAIGQHVDMQPMQNALISYNQPSNLMLPPKPPDEPPAEPPAEPTSAPPALPFALTPAPTLVPTSALPMPPPEGFSDPYATTTNIIAPVYGDAESTSHEQEQHGDSDNPWMMGGSAGTGLSSAPPQPPPSAPPPPPP